MSRYFRNFSCSRSRQSRSPWSTASSSSGQNHSPASSEIWSWAKEWRGRSRQRGPPKNIFGHTRRPNLTRRMAFALGVFLVYWAIRSWGELALFKVGTEGWSIRTESWTERKDTDVEGYTVVGKFVDINGEEGHRIHVSLICILRLAGGGILRNMDYTVRGSLALLRRQKNDTMCFLW